MSNALETQGKYVDNEGVYHRGAFRISMSYMRIGMTWRVQVWGNDPTGHKDTVVYTWVSEPKDDMGTWDEVERLMENYGLRPRDITQY